ncbi:MAG: extracellular solute-binding protein [Lachnospiraceae bacterium]|nr:extracellular solute-binding protein [Lachnospiraceae bacterium]
MKAKKIVALLLTAAMTLSLMACGGSSSTSTETAETAATETKEETAATETEAAATEEEAEDLLADVIPEETVTLDVYDQLANYSGEQIGWFGQIMLEKFNVKLNIIPETDGVYETRMESGNLGDLVIWGNDGDEYLQAVEKGLLYDWNEDDLLAEYGPYIKENMTYALEKNAQISGGTTYGFGFDVAIDSSARQDGMYTWDLRWDLYKELGYPEIKNLDDMVEVLAQMQEICPTDDNGKPTYGVSLFNDWDGDMVMFVKSTATAYYGYDEFGFGLYDPETQTYYPCLQEDGPYLTCLKFYNTLYQRGLLDPDSQTQKYDGMVEDYQNGTAFLNVFNFLGSAMYNSEAHAAEGKAMYPCIPSEARPIAYGQNVYGGNRPWTIGAKTEYPELCMAIYNWLSTPEGRMVAEYGPKDICWYYGEDGLTYFTDLGKAAKLDGKTEMAEGYSGTFEDGNFKMNNTTWGIDSPNPETNGETYNYKKWASFTAEPGSDIEADWRDHTGCATPDEYFGTFNYVLAPGTMYSAGVKSDELQVIWNQVATCIKDNSWKAIYAASDAEFDQIVADMIAQADEYGYAQCVEFQENEAKLRAAAEDAVK